MIIVFGASGFLGSYCFRYFKEKDPKTIGTYFSQRHENLVHFDIMQSDINDVNLDGIRYALICTGETNIDTIKKASGHFSELNVTKTIELIANLRKRNIVPIYISTDCVFGGERGQYKEEDIRIPETIYGKQKVIVENYIMESIPEYLIIRISKILSEIHEEKNWLCHWVEALLSGKNIYCAQDQLFCPTHVKDIVKGIDLLIQHHATGTYHVAHPKGSSKHDMGIALCEMLGREKRQVIPININEIGLQEKRPMNITLDSSKYRAMTKHTFIDWQEAVKILQTSSQYA